MVWNGVRIRVFCSSSMASIIAHLKPVTPFACSDHEEQRVRGLRGFGVSHPYETFSGRCISRVSICSRTKGLAAVGRSRVNGATDLLGVSDSANSTSTVEIRVTCYQLLGVQDQAEKDEIVKSVMQLKGAEIEEGYTMDAVVSRQELLMDLRDKLLFEPEYAGNMREKIPPKASLRIPWTWLPGALCLLQEVGEAKLALEIGCRILEYPGAKPHVHDLLLSMALSECAIAKIGLEKNKVALGFEALARAQCLLRSKSSLAKMTLLSQIEESLEELAPACTLEILGMPHVAENAERRSGAIAALQELLRQGLDVETSRQVQDWPCFLNHAFSRLKAAEIVDLLPWDTLAVTRKNKKSLESQNQRVVIDFNCFYTVIKAHLALGFSSKRTELINKGKTICECLIASDGIDLKFEETFCLLLLGKAQEAEAVEKLQQLQLNSAPVPRNSLSDKDKKNVFGTDPSLEIWLRDAVLDMFPDTRDCSPSLVNFFGGGKRSSPKREQIGAQTVPIVNQRPLRTSLTSEHGDIEGPVSYVNSSQHFGPAVKQLARADLHNPLVSCKNASGIHNNSSSFQLKRDIGMRHGIVWERGIATRDMIRTITFAAVLGCVVFATLKLSSMKIWRTKMCEWNSRPSMEASTLSWATDSSADHSARYARVNRNGVAGTLEKLLGMIKMPLRNHPETGDLRSSCITASLSSSVAALSRRPMCTEEAEALVKHWQAIKAEALGPNHHFYGLSEVLDESMLDQWQTLADAAKEKNCFWRFVLLQFSVLRADILSDNSGAELAEIEALLEEAAELVDESQHKNPNYYSTYKIHYILKRQDDGSWKFCECEVQG